MIQALLDNLPALQVVLPLMAAPICFILRKSNLAWAMGFYRQFGCIFYRRDLIRKSF